ncbi:MAG: zf-HC2 domain-containing protein [Gemmatimonadota bacterium]|nr:MAG: zf-HC2 domain-containing protein [Gemmatimonadota bacterium]
MDAGMMAHIVEGELLAYLDGELAPERRSTLSLHLDECQACAADLAALRSASQELTAALRRVDVPAPAIDLETLVDRRAIRGTRRLAGRALFKAAVLVLAVGGVSAAAIPGSPVRGWIGGALQGAKGLLGIGDAETPAAVVEAPVSAEPEVARVAVAPLNGTIRISLTAPAPETLVRVRLVEGEQASVAALGARFRTGPGWIEVLEAGPGELRIELPRSLPSGRVEVDGRAVVVKGSSSLELVSEPDSSGSELMFRAGR